jgi:ribose transport system ATP-binding protein
MVDSDYILSLEGINKSFGGVKVLDNVDFKIRKGEVHALVGGNGAGKSTLMKILTGVYRRDSGTIRLKGIETKINNPTEAQKNGIRIIFQELSLVPTLTIAENIFLIHEIKKFIFLNKKEMNKKADKLLKDLGINIDVNLTIKDLSVGQCQLVEIAKALSVNSSILVMDEPTAALTEYETKILFEIIKTLKSKGVSIVYISHRMKEVFEVADEISVLRDGKLVATKRKTDLTLEKVIDYILGKKVEKKMEWRDRKIKKSDSSMLEVENLSFGSRLSNVSFKLKKGEVLGIAGLMGSGKTELVESLFGLNREVKGKIILEGKPVHFKNVQQAMKNGLSLVPESRRRQGLVLSHSLKENIILPNLFSQLKRLIINNFLANKIVKESIKEFNIIATNGMNTLLENMSGGNQQKVVLAKWLKTKPKIILMDEPTTGVDVGAKAEIIDIIRNFVNLNTSVIFISSEISELIDVCDRIMIFKKGRIIKEFTHNQIKSEEEIHYAIQH